jgi:hypothetical protein
LTAIFKIPSSLCGAQNLIVNPTLLDGKAEKEIHIKQPTKTFAPKLRPNAPKTSMIWAKLDADMRRFAESCTLIIEHLGRGKGRVLRCEGYDSSGNLKWTVYGLRQANGAYNFMKSHGKPVKIITKRPNPK